MRRRRREFSQNKLEISNRSGIKKRLTNLRFSKRQIKFIPFFLLMCISCDNLPFSSKDSQSSQIKPKEKKIELVNRFYTVYKGSSEPENPPSSDKKKTIPEKTFYIAEETTSITEDMNLKANTIIHSKKVILEATIKTFQYDLTITADEFISNNAVIQNFPEGQKAKQNTHGKNGGNILIETKKTKGNLQLILNGEHGSPVPERHLSKTDLARFKGNAGERGTEAVYQTVCQKNHPKKWEKAAYKIAEQNGFFGFSAFFIVQEMQGNYPCFDVCLTPPTKGEEGRNGRIGLEGFNGKNGGHSGSFRLRAFYLSDFHLTNIQNVPGIGSEGGEGTPGDFGGKGGQNGKDRKNLCAYSLPHVKRGRRGETGPKGRNGINGEKVKSALSNSSQIMRWQIPNLTIKEKARLYVIEL